MKNTLTQSAVVALFALGSLTAFAPLAFAETVFPGSGSASNGVVCTQEAKICPDGSGVGRTGPNCEFAACPGGGNDDGNVQNGLLSASPVSGSAPLTVVFGASGLGSGQNEVYIIEYGDGSNSGALKSSDCAISNGITQYSCFTAKHTYAVSGTYTASLYPYTACLWNEPSCEIDVPILGSVTVKVADQNGTIKNEVISTENKETSPPSEYWTPERMREAKPIDMYADGTINAENTGFFGWVTNNFWNFFGNNDDNGCGTNGKLCPNVIGNGNDSGCGENGQLCPNVNNGGNGNDGNVPPGPTTNDNGTNAGNDGNVNNDGNVGNGSNDGNINAAGNVNGSANVENRGFFRNIIWNFLNLF